MASKEQLRAVASTPKAGLPSGVDLMRTLSDSGVSKAPSEFIQQVRSAVTESCDEMIEIGARIRPLMVGSEQIGWCRGIHNTERRRISRWVTDPNEYVVNTLSLATTLNESEIRDMSSIELRNIVQLIKKMSEYDFSLYPYLSAFTSTLVSENLWHGYGTKLTSFENKDIQLPKGQSMRILVPSDHARLWATLCVYREQAKVRLDASWNAILQVRPMAGKSVDPLAAELKINARLLSTNAIEPWESVVANHTPRNLDDGWAHAENLDTREGMMKELQGMLSEDKHEQLIAKFEKQQVEAAEERMKAIADVSRRRGGAGIHEETIEVFSEAEFREREKELRKGKPRPPVPIDRDKMEVVKDPVSRMKRYQ